MKRFHIIILITLIHKKNIHLVCIIYLIFLKDCSMGLTSHKIFCHIFCSDGAVLPMRISHGNYRIALRPHPSPNDQQLPLKQKSKQIFSFFNATKSHGTTLLCRHFVIYQSRQQNGKSWNWLSSIFHLSVS